MFGSRGTGKSSLLKKLFEGQQRVHWVDLLDDELARKYSINPRVFEQEVLALLPEWVILDEVQKVPSLLDYVHKLIESKKIKFALTGSSSRKLKRGGANLLAGRAFLNHLYPLTSFELGKDFDLNEALHWGGLPMVINSKSVEEKKEYLRSYVNTYLREEIKEEQLVRRVDPFLKFLDVSAQSNGQILNYSKIARDAGTDYKSVERYFEILVDTMLGFYLEPYHTSVRKRQSAKSKFYFFDTGVKKSLEGSLNVPLQERTFAYGNAFEHFIVLECLRYRDYFKTDDKLSYLRTKDDLEVDLIIERPGQKKILVEIKSTRNFDEAELSRYRSLKRDLAPCEFLFFTQEERPRKIDGFEILPWREGLRRLYG
jgi:predicted AAA+ superfamily ATPase